MFNVDAAKISKNDKTISKSEKPSVKDLVGLGSSKEVTNAVNLKRNLYL